MKAYLKFFWKRLLYSEIAGHEIIIQSETKIYSFFIR